MKPKRLSSSKAIQPAMRCFEGFVRELKTFISESRRQIVSAVDFAQVQTCWGVGRYIVEYEQGGQRRAEYGAILLANLAEELTADFGKGFDASNLYKMKQFYTAFPILDSVSLKLSWTHYRTPQIQNLAKALRSSRRSEMATLLPRMRQLLSGFLCSFAPQRLNHASLSLL
jgi:hypothetical protein